MRLYQSGTPKDDPYQFLENRVCTYRLFSMHGDYDRAVHRWMDNVLAGIVDVDSYLHTYPQREFVIKQADIARRAAQHGMGDSRDWDTIEVLREVCKTVKGTPLPTHILLDSGAFSAWNKGEETFLDEVIHKYRRFIERAGNLFKEIWLINLDKIPGERGRDPTQEELKEAIEISDKNFAILEKEFGNIVLPVYHQGEPLSRLAEVVDQVKHGSKYICVSPRNDVAEIRRVEWSAKCHSVLNRDHPGIMTHGLATTGNNMITTVPWYSGDSSAWIQIGSYGLVNVVFADNKASKKPVFYKTYYVAINQMTPDTNGYGELTNSRVEDSAFFDRCTPGIQNHVRETIESYGFPFEVSQWDFRCRMIVSMGEFEKFAEWARRTAQTVMPPASLFGGLDGLDS